MKGLTTTALSGKSFCQSITPSLYQSKDNRSHFTWKRRTFFLGRSQSEGCDDIRTVFLPYLYFGISLLYNVVSLTFYPPKKYGGNNKDSFNVVVVVVVIIHCNSWMSYGT